MTDLYDKTVETVEVTPSNDRLVQEEEIIRESSEDETRSTTVKAKKFPALWCGHYKPYGFSCFCGNRFCRSCLDEGRVRYCEVCGRTIGPCHYEKREDGDFCPEHRPAFDWKGPWGQAVASAGLLGGLAVAIYVLFHLVR
jgi:hypothetical protein